MMKNIVIKCGGSILDQLPPSFYKNIVQLQQENWQPVIVHGGGPMISTLLSKLGINTCFVDGLRVTTNEVLDVVEMVLSGLVNKQMVRNIMDVGGYAYGISGVDGALLQAKPTEKAAELGYVGEVCSVNKQMIDQIIKQGYIPVISPIGIDNKGQRYNINGDYAASAVAQKLEATLCFISNIPGLYKEEAGERNTLHTVTKQMAEEMVEEKMIKGGMIPKVKAAIEGLLHDVKEVGIINGLEANSLIDFASGKQIGTKILL